MKILGNRKSFKLLVLLLLADFAFIFANGLHYINILENPLLSITKDLGYAEFYQYIKQYWIVILLLLMSLIKNQRSIYLTWSLLFLYLLIDDSLQVHEKFGAYLAEYFGFEPMFGLRSIDFGELSVLVIFGTLLFALIGWSYFFSGKAARRMSKHLLILVISLAFFGVFVDMVHVAIPWGKSVWGLLEDGGEMMIMSAIVWYVFDLETAW